MPGPAGRSRKLRRSDLFRIQSQTASSEFRLQAVRTAGPGVDRGHLNMRHLQHVAPAMERGRESRILLRALSRTFDRSADIPMSDVWIVAA